MANSPLLTMPILKMQEGVTLCDSDYCHYPLCRDFIEEGVLQFGGIILGFGVSGADGGAGFSFSLSPRGDSFLPRIGGRANPAILGTPCYFANYNWSTELYISGLHFPTCSSTTFQVNCASYFRPPIKGVGGSVSLNRFIEMSKENLNGQWCSTLIVKTIREMFKDGTNARTLFNQLADLKTNINNYYAATGDCPTFRKMPSNDRKSLNFLLGIYYGSLLVGEYECGGVGIHGRGTYYYLAEKAILAKKQEVKEILRLMYKYEIHYAIAAKQRYGEETQLGQLVNSSTVNRYNDFWVYYEIPTISYQSSFVLFFRGYLHLAYEYYTKEKLNYDYLSY